MAELNPPVDCPECGRPLDDAGYYHCLRCTARMLSDEVARLRRAAVADPDALQSDGVELRPCAKCRCPLAIIMGPNGKKIPLDLRTQVYTVTKDALGHATAMPLPGAHPTHFATCTHSDSFGKGKRK